MIESRTHSIEELEKILRKALGLPPEALIRWLMIHVPPANYQETGYDKLRGLQGTLPGKS